LKTREINQIASNLTIHEYNSMKKQHINYRQHVLLIILLLLFSPAGLIADSDYYNLQSIDITKDKTSFYNKYGYSILPEIKNNYTIPTDTFVCINDLVVPEGTLVTIQKGTHLLFESGKQMLINGTLSALGDSLEPIILTNVPFEQSYIPLAQKEDSIWNGIETGLKGKINLKHVAIKNTRQGIITSSSSDSLTLKCINFFNVLGKSINCTDTMFTGNATCFSLNKQIVVPPLSEKHLYNSNINRHLIISGVNTLAFSALTGALFYYKNKSVAKANNATTIYKVNGNADRAHTMRNLAIASGLLAGAGVSWCTITFTIKYSNKNKYESK
jgi:hypothetical protein